MRSVFESGKQVQRTVLSMVGLAVLVTGNALAGTANSNMSATADVTNNCVISAGALAFGAYDPVSANTSSDQPGTATLSVTCTNGAAAKITLGQGLHPDTNSSDSVPLRRLQSGSDYLSYSLWQNSGYTTVWANTTSSPDTSEGYTGTGSSTSPVVYGYITHGQNGVHAGSFTDTVVVTITF